MGRAGSARKLDRAADLPRERVEPVVVRSRERRSPPGERRAASRPALPNAARRSSARASNAARSCASSNSEARGARADDLDEAEAVDRGPLERLRQDASIASAASWRAALPRRSADRSRSIRRYRAGGSLGRLPPRRATASSLGRKIAVDVDQGHRRRRRDPQLAAGERDDAAARFVDQIVPAQLAEFVVGTPGNAGRRPRAARAARQSASSVRRASGRFHGSAPGIASRVTSIVSARPA